MLELAKNEYEMNGEKVDGIRRHIVCMQEYIQLIDRRAIVLEYCERGSLQDLVEQVRDKNKFLAPTIVLRFFEQVSVQLFLSKLKLEYVNFNY